MPVGARIKVLFLVHHIEAWDSLSDVYQEMLKLADFEPIVASVNRRFPGEEDYGFEPIIHEKLKEAGIEHLRFGMRDSYQALDIIKAIKPDIIFRQSQWDYDLPPAFHVHELTFARLCYVPYGILAMIQTQSVGEGERDVVSDTDWHRLCWRIFYATEQDVERISKTSARQSQNVVATGHPKVARLIREGQLNEHWPIKGNKNALRIIWSPHHSVGDDWNKFGLFPVMYKKMLAWAKSDAHVEIVFSLHPALFPRLRMAGSGVSVKELDMF